MTEVRWYVMHDHGTGEGGHAHSTEHRHNGDVPNHEHHGIPTETWEENREKYYPEWRER